MNLLSVRLRWDPDRLKATTGIIFELRRSKAGIVGVRVESISPSLSLPTLPVIVQPSSRGHFVCALMTLF